MIISIKKICKLSLYFTLFYFLLYDNIVIAENITESFNKIKKEEQLDTITNLKLLNLYNQKVTISKLNESKNLESLIPEIVDIIGSRDISNYEILIVDDGSVDDSNEVC